jgi:hypothetical protein
MRGFAELFFAAHHVVGAIAVSAALVWAAHKASEWWGDRVQDRCWDDFSLALGIPASVLKTKRPSEQFIRFLSERYSSEWFRNRLSDLVDHLLLIFELLCLLTQLVIVGVVSWDVFSRGASQAATIWVLPLIGAFSIFIQSIVVVLCMALFGRAPGEPKVWRKFVAQSIERQAG